MDAGNIAEPARKVVRAHDLLWLSDLLLTCPEPVRPEWLTADWLLRAPAVVRRENTSNGIVPVGLRGKVRSERFKAYAESGKILRKISPEEILMQPIDKALARFPVVGTLIRIAPAINATGLCWGPTGGVGFTLASGLVVVNNSSDLDLVIRAPQPLSIALSSHLVALCSSVQCRVDLQIETPLGAFAFTEWMSGSQRVLLKAETGPMLTAHPWGQSTQQDLRSV